MTQKQNTQLVTIHNNLKSLLQSKQKALPTNFNETRFLQNAMTVLADTRGIETIDPASVTRTMLQGAFLGLDFFNKECYAIPYNENVGTKEKPQWVKKIQFQTDYKGEIKLAKMYSINPIADIYAKIVRKGDIFHESIIDGHQSITFKPQPFNEELIAGVFAVCLYKDGTMIYESMGINDIELIKQASKTPTGPAWKLYPGEMAKKAVIRRLRKMIQLEFKSPEADAAFEEGGQIDFTDYETIEPDPIKDPIKDPKPIGQPDKTTGHQQIPKEETAAGPTETITDKEKGPEIANMESGPSPKDEFFDEWLEHPVEAQMKLYDAYMKTVNGFQLRTWLKSHNAETKPFSQIISAPLRVEILWVLNQMERAQQGTKKP
jgi:recombination protein RecT